MGKTLIGVVSVSMLESFHSMKKTSKDSTYCFLVGI